MASSKLHFKSITLMLPEKYIKGRYSILNKARPPVKNSEKNIQNMSSDIFHIHLFIHSTAND